MDKVIKRDVYYFDEPGEGNTRLVIEAVSQRLEVGRIKKVIVASTSGETAAKFARSLKGKTELICVSEAPYVFHNSVLEAARWPGGFPERVVKETLYCFGQGIKEIIAMPASKKWWE